ncbi:hypothetical protein CFOL_v3_24765 [Cephalotus follicularis]|uniref:RVT_2 domain-containing protein n=1 Tax=Cephalotus follicularis TaxID=3775 RepID=A0A1Q3CM45_CEPFO|nr:hypothetical protein CFOL_v3_24765 [Cephalotus follicularis]
MATPTDVQWAMVQRILRYLKGTITHGLQLQRSSSLSLAVYSDADWEIDFHFVRDQVAKRALQVRFISTRDQLADVLTKGLSA